MKRITRARFARNSPAALSAVLLAALVALASPALTLSLCAQAPAPAPRGDPTVALEDALSAACRQDDSAFANHLTGENAEAYRKLPLERRTTILKRVVLLEDPGKALLTTSADGRPVLRCNGAGVMEELKLGPAQVRENLAFIRVEVPEAGQSDDEIQHVRFGLVREAGDWKLISMGLLLLDIGELEHEWEKSDADALESQAVDALHKISQALKVYHAAFGKLPEGLDQLGPATDSGGISEDKAGLLDKDLASGTSGGYAFRYVIIAANVRGDDSDRDKAAAFSLAATPVEYGKGAKQSFYLDANGALHSADKHGAVATVDDPAASDAPPDESPHP